MKRCTSIRRASERAGGCWLTVAAVGGRWWWCWLRRRYPSSYCPAKDLLFGFLFFFLNFFKGGFVFNPVLPIIYYRSRTTGMASKQKETYLGHMLFCLLSLELKVFEAEAATF